MRSAKPVKRVLLGLLVLCILLAGGWYLLTPFPIGKAMHADEPFSLSVVTAGVSVTGKATTESVTSPAQRNTTHCFPCWTATPITAAFSRRCPWKATPWT